VGRLPVGARHKKGGTAPGKEVSDSTTMPKKGKERTERYAKRAKIDVGSRHLEREIYTIRYNKSPEPTVSQQEAKKKKPDPRSKEDASGMLGVGPQEESKTFKRGEKKEADVPRLTTKTPPLRNFLLCASD